MLRRLPAILLTLIIMAVFYLFAVMQENEETKRSDAFVVREPEEAITRIAPFYSQDARALAQAFGAAFPLPEGSIEEVNSFQHHGYTARRILVKGQVSRVEGPAPERRLQHHAGPPALPPRGAGPLWFFPAGR